MHDNLLWLSNPVEWQGTIWLNHQDYERVYFRFDVLPEHAVGTPNEDRQRSSLGLLLQVSGSQLQCLSNQILGQATAPVRRDLIAPHLFHYVQQHLLHNGLPADQHEHVVPSEADLCCSNPENVKMGEPFRVPVKKGRIGFSEA